MSYIIFYFLLGLLWAGWLEWYCCNNLEKPYNSSFHWRERVFHTFLVPISFGIFIFNIVKDCLK